MAKKTGGSKLNQDGWQLWVFKVAELMCRRSKCCFRKVKIKFLGHVVGVDVINVPEARMRVIREHLLPRTRKQLRAFLGLVLELQPLVFYSHALNIEECSWDSRVDKPYDRGLHNCSLKL